MSSNIKKDTYRTLMYWLVMTSFIFSLVYVPLRSYLDESYRSGGAYKIMIFQTVCGIIEINLPSFLEKRFNLKIPRLFAIMFLVFVWGAIFLGEVADFYYRFPFWDDILHLWSSMMLGFLGFSLIEILNNDKKHNKVSLSPIFVCIFATLFTVSIGALWEIYEFISDGILGINMQKYALGSAISDTGVTLLEGREALKDTMTDLIVDFIGGLVASAVGYVSIIKNTGWIDTFKVSFNEKEGDKNV